MEKGPDDAGPLNRSGNPRYRLDDVSLVADLLPLNIRFFDRWALFVGQRGHNNCECSGAMWATPHSAYEWLHLWRRDHVGLRSWNAWLRHATVLPPPSDTACRAPDALPDLLGAALAKDNRKCVRGRCPV